jgi:protein-S-isoprenylcysteine O-methyltransferase
VDSLISKFHFLPGYGICGFALIVLYFIQAEVRFGARARSNHMEATDRHSTSALTIALLICVIGFALAMKAAPPKPADWLPAAFRAASLPAMPALAWCGVAVGALGISLRLWAVLTLRERYTRTLLIQPDHTVVRTGPYRWVRHPGYLGSLLCLNGIALASGNWMSFITSVAATSIAYGYRIKIEDQMLLATFGADYSSYKASVGALFPKFYPRLG